MIESPALLDEPSGLMICTSGDSVSLGYFSSCMALQKAFLEIGMNAVWLCSEQTDLNEYVSIFMKSDHEYLMIIPSDVEFAVDDIARLWSFACEGSDVVGSGSILMIKRAVFEEVDSPWFGDDYLADLCRWHDFDGSTILGDY